MRRSLTIILAVVLTLGFVAAGCSSSKKADTATTGTTTASAPVTGTITVSAAASLTGAFGTIKDQFVAANPGANVTINFGSSGTLETQIEGGAPVDVAAFADEATMAKLSDKSLLAAPAADLRHQPARDRHQARQPEEHPEPRRPRHRRHGLAVRRHRPVRQVRQPDPARPPT